MGVHMPPGKRVAVCLTFDVDITSLWLGTFKMGTMNPMSRARFGLEGLRRILDLLAKYDLRGTFYVPGHTAIHHPSEVRTIVERGHELGSHGMYHQLDEVGAAGPITPEQMQEYLRLQLAAIEEATGVRPVGFRSPIGDYGPVMPELLVDEGYRYDSSLQGSDFFPYRLGVGESYGLTEPYEIDFGRPSPIVEIPWMWDVNDFPHFEYISYYLDPGNPWYAAAPLSSPEKVKEVWLGHFDYLYESLPGGVFTAINHPQCTGRGMRLMWFEQVIQHMLRRPDVWFATHGEIAAAFSD
jgi:peptidoglycan-N-acetylglucosamine deacetylase